MVEPPSSIFVLSSINDDLILRVDHLPSPGETILSTNLAHSLGGKGANTAVAASKAHSNVHFVGAVGDDVVGSSLLERLHTEHQVSVDNVQCIPNGETGQAVIYVDQTGENCIVVHTGSNAKVKEEMLQKAISKQNVMSNTVVAFHFEIPLSTVRRAAEYVKSIDGIVILNPSPVPQSTSSILNVNSKEGDIELWSFIDILIVNEGELNSLCTGIHVNKQDNEDTRVLKCVKYLRENFKAVEANIIVTLGARGAVLVLKQQNEITRINAIAVKSEDVIDTTGAGDCLTGYMCAGIARHWNIEVSLKFAVAAASLCVQRKGTAEAMPSFDEVQPLISD